MAEAAQTDRGPVEDLDDYGTDEVDGFLKNCVKLFNRCVTAEQENRINAVDDLKFKEGNQWPENIKSARTAEKRPCLTINKVKTFVHQITNDQRQNRPAINVSPIGDKADPETAKMLKGLIKQIERQSNADVAYDTGFDNAVSNGWGYWRLVTDYESEDSFDQVIRIQRIRNPFRVYMDPDSEEPDGSDAKWCFISDLVIREDFKDEYPDADEVAWGEGTLGDEYKDWSTQTHIRIAEYFYFEYEDKTLVGFSTGHQGFDDEPEIASLIELDKSLVIKEREVRVPKIKWCKLTAHEILEENEWLGRWIPIVKCIGDEVDVEGKVSLAGLIRDMKDPQRMYNFWCTSETELIALAPKAPWIMEEGQVEGHEQRWKEANTKSLPYLLYKGTSISGKPSPIPQRQQFVGPPVGVVNAKQGAAQDMQAVTGVRFDATIHERTSDESGKALRELKRVGDLASFHYVDNLSRSLRHTGRILIDLIPKVYDTRRVLTILREDDSEQTVVLDPNLQQPHIKSQDAQGKVMRLYNPKLGEYEVAVTIGPSFATKRQESSESMMAFMKTLPETAPLIADLVARNQDWPGSEEIATRLQSQLPPNMQDKNMEDLPPEARGMVQSLQQQLQQLKQERDRAVSMLGDKDKDRAIDQDKINKDFEAKMAAIAAGMQETIIKLQAEGQENNQAAMEKISKDFEAKVTQMVMDFQLETAKLAQERELRQQEMDMKAGMEAAKLASGEQVEGEKIASSERIEKSSRRREDVVKEESAMKEVLQVMTKVMEGITKPKKRRMKKVSEGVYEAEEI